MNRRLLTNDEVRYLFPMVYIFALTLGHHQRSDTQATNLDSLSLPLGMLDLWCMRCLAPNLSFGLAFVRKRILTPYDVLMRELILLFKNVKCIIVVDHVNAPNQQMPPNPPYESR